MSYRLSCLVIFIAVPFLAMPSLAATKNNSSMGVDQSVEACLASLRSLAQGGTETAELAKVLVELDEARHTEWEEMLMHTLKDMYRFRTKLRQELKKVAGQFTRAMEKLEANQQTLRGRIKTLPSLAKSLKEISEQVREGLARTDQKTSIEELQSQLALVAELASRIGKVESRINENHQSDATAVSSAIEGLNGRMAQLTDLIEHQWPAKLNQTIADAVLVERLAVHPPKAQPAASRPTRPTPPVFFRLPSLSQREAPIDSLKIEAYFDRVDPDFLKALKAEPIENLVERCEFPVQRGVHTALKQRGINTLDDLLKVPVESLEEGDAQFNPRMGYSKISNLKMALGLLAKYLETFPPSQMKAYQEVVQSYIKRDEILLATMRKNPDRLFKFLNKQLQDSIYKQSNQVVEGRVTFNDDTAIKDSHFLFVSQAQELLHYRNRLYLQWLVEGANPNALPAGAPSPIQPPLFFSIDVLAQ
jgi:hypothetical protein